MVIFLILQNWLEFIAENKINVVKHLDIKVQGRVQGVFYRAATKEKAEELDLVGFARNEPDNSVYIEVEGKEENLKQFINWCKSGSDNAEVQNLDIQEGKIKNFSKFEIVFDS